jgi:rubredoxin
MGVKSGSCWICSVCGIVYGAPAERYRAVVKMGVKSGSCRICSVCGIVYGAPAGRYRAGGKSGVCRMCEA